MTFEESWNDKENGVSYILAEDINSIAHETIALRNDLTSEVDRAKLSESEKYIVIDVAYVDGSYVLEALYTYSEIVNMIQSNVSNVFARKADTDEMFTFSEFGEDYIRFSKCGTDFVKTLDIYPTKCVLTEQVLYNRTSILNTVYPVGSIITLTNDSDPNEFTPFVWEKIVNRFLYGAGGTASLGATGGSSSVKLVSAQIPVAYTGDEATGYGLSEQVAFKDRVAIRRTDGTATQATNIMPPYLAVNIWQRVE